MRKIVFITLSLCFIWASSASAEVWGDAGFGYYFLGEKDAPNELIYKPLWHLEMNLNIGKRSTLYLFIESVFYAERPSPGITTHLTRPLEFTKREFDLILGVAKPLFDTGLEIRLWGYSLANLNRGRDKNVPSGFKDGYAAEARYYFEIKEFVGYVTGGYYFTKGLVDPSGDYYRPGVFAGVNLIRPIVRGVSVFGEALVLTEKFTKFREVDSKIGIEFSPFRKYSHPRFSIVYEIDQGRDANLERLLIQAKVYFKTSPTENISDDIVSLD